MQGSVNLMRANFVIMFEPVDQHVLVIAMLVHNESHIIETFKNVYKYQQKINQDGLLRQSTKQLSMSIATLVTSSG